jgi:ATP-dependent helicase/nuclease subunit A
MTPASHTEDARDRAFARGGDGGLDATCLVEAGAGTGKTSVLIDRLLSLVLSGTSASRIVAITFTEKAAGELRVRFRSRVEEAARNRSGEERERLDAAVREIDRAQVGTIHGFCAGLLRERPVEAGVDPNFSVADELRQTILLDSAWDKWLRGELSRDLPGAAAEARALGFGLGRIRDLAGRLAEARDVIHLMPSPLDPGDLEGFLAELGAEAREFFELARTGARDPEDGAATAIHVFARAVEALALLPDEARAPFALARIAPAPSKRQGRKTNWDEGLLDQLRERAARLKERQADLLARAGHNATVGLVQWLAGYLRAYEAEKSSAGILDFQDLLSKARDLLRDDPGVREHFKCSYDRILVDEFQDTDPLQCEIAFFLAEQKGRSAKNWLNVKLEPGKLFIVGDPKQSIYRFRRADIETYESARDMIAKSGSVLKLTENFRTRPSIIGAVNAVFDGAMTAPGDGRRYQPDYEALVAHRPVDEEGPGVTFITPSSAFGGGAKAAEIRGAEAEAVAAFISRSLASGRPRVLDRESSSWRPVRQGDIAVLFHSMTALDAYEAAFSARGLDYRIAGGKRFYVRREVSELATVLAAVDDPHDLVSVVGALRTPFMGVSDEEIVVHRERTGGLNYLTRAASGVPAVESAFRILRELHERRNAGGVAELIRRLLTDTAALELFLLKPAGEQRHANLLKVVELASSLEKDEPMSFGGFVRWLREVSQLTPEEAESPLSEEGDDFIRMLTIHRAKGLEFPVAVLADLGRVTRRAGSMIVDREEGRLDVGIGSRKERLATLGYEDARALEERRETAERLRLLYVGMTRARDALVIPWFPGEEVGATGLLEHLEGLTGPAGEGARPDVELVDAGALDLGRDAARQVRLSATDALGAADAAAGTAELAEWEGRLEAFAQRHDRPPLIVTPSALAHVPGGGPETDSCDSGTPPAAGMRFGTLVHAVMERADFEAPESVAATAEALARAMGAGADEAAEATRLIESSLESNVMRRARTSVRTFREVPFCVRRGDAVIDGKIDLLFQEADGLVVVDYKTDRLPEGGTGLLAGVYRDQAAVYGIAAGLATGLPVKEVVLLFMRGPTEERIAIRGSLEERERSLDELIVKASAPRP